MKGEPMEITQRTHEGPMPGTPEWQEARRVHITASEIAAVMGMSEYKTAYEVWAEKMGLMPAFTGNESTARGHRYEAAILGDYADRNEVELRYPLPLIECSTLPCLAATPDAQWVARDFRLVEAKFSMSANRAAELGEEGTDAIPYDWLLQTQAQMECVDVEFADVAVLLYGRLRVFNVRRHPDITAAIRDAATELSERIANNDPPEPDYRHPRTLQVLRAIHGVKGDVKITLDAGTVEAWHIYKQTGDKIKSLEEIRDEAQARVLSAMGDAAVGELGDGYEVSRSRVSESLWTDADIAEISAKLGQVKRNGYVTLRQRKAK